MKKDSKHLIITKAFIQAAAWMNTAHGQPEMAKEFLLDAGLSPNEIQLYGEPCDVAGLKDVLKKMNGKFK